MRRRHFPLFDSLRAIAAMSVLTFHAILFTPQLGVGPVGRVGEVLGSVGVLLFFCISGFLLYRPFAEARALGEPFLDVRGFLRRRALRIVPAYWAILTLLAIWPGLEGPFSEDFWRYYGFLQLYDADTWNLGLPVAWSLCVEVTFYLGLPLWAWAMRGSSWRFDLLTLAAWAASGVLLQLLAVRHAELVTLSRTVLGQAPWFALGMALAVLSAQGLRPRVNGAVAWAGAAVALAALALQVPDGGIFGLIDRDRIQGVDGGALRIALSFAFVALLVAPAVFGDEGRDPVRRLLASRALTWVGLISYSVFLWHFPLAERLAEETRAWGAIWLAVTAATLVLSWVTYRFVERPFIRRAGSRAW